MNRRGNLFNWAGNACACLIVHYGNGIHRAITQSVACSLFICFVIATLFLGATYSIDVSVAVACLFLTALALFAGSMISFLREIYLATKSLRFVVPPLAAPGVDEK